MADLRIEHFTSNMAGEVAALLARAFVTNPLHVAAFGPRQLGPNETFFQIGVPLMTGRKLVAVESGEILGFIHWIESPGCRPSEAEKRELAPRMLRAFGIRTGWRLRSWLTTWAAQDPSSPHVHLGPLGVLPSAQGRGIGRRLMERYCRALDQAGRTGYLETDRTETVSFYERFGFQVTAEIEVLHLPNFLMTRVPRGTGDVTV